MGSKLQILANQYILGLIFTIIFIGCAGKQDTPLERLNSHLDTLHWLAYAPTGFNPTTGTFPSQDSIREDLLLAKQHGFDGLITYALDDSLASIPRIAKEVGFTSVIAGVFMFNEQQKQEELANIDSIEPFVDGWSVGNEGLIGCSGDLYTSDELLSVFQTIRAKSDKPITTSEQFEDYENGCNDDFLLKNGDWLMPIVQPYNNNQCDPVAGATFVKDKLIAILGLTDKKVLAKEVGWPSEGDDSANEANQEAFFITLKSHATTINYAYFEGYNQLFKVTFPNEWEPYFGLWDENRNPKQFIENNTP